MFTGYDLYPPFLNLLILINNVVVTMQEKRAQSTNDPEKKGNISNTRERFWIKYGKPAYERQLGRSLSPDEEKSYKAEWIASFFSEETEENGPINRERVIEILEGVVGKKMDEELKELLNIPLHLYKKKGNTYLAFSKEPKLDSVVATDHFFMTFYLSKSTPLPSKEHYGIMVSESTNQGYLTFFDGSRRVAVKALIYSYQDEKVRGWNELKEGLKEALEAVEKEPENIIIAYQSGIKRFDMHKKKLL